MKILHIIKEHTESGQVDTVIADQKGLGHDVTVFKLWDEHSLVSGGEKDYDKLVDLIFSNDQVYTW